MRWKIKPISKSISNLDERVAELSSNLANGVYVSNCNNATSGHIFYYADENTLNKPSGTSSWLLIKVIGKSGDFFTQIASEENVINGRIWYRTKSANSFGDWVEISKSKKYVITSSSPASFAVPFAHGAFLLSGIFQGVGGTTLLVQLYDGSVSYVVDLCNLKAFNSEYFTITATNSTVTITTTLAQNTTVTATLLC